MNYKKNNIQIASADTYTEITQVGKSFDTIIWKSMLNYI